MNVRRALLAIAALALLFAPASVAAQDETSASSCVGTWLLRVTALGQPVSTGFSTTATFGADGTFIGTPPPVTAGPPDAPEAVTFTSTVQGVWEATESGACAVTHVFYNSDAQGDLVNTIEIRIVLVVGADGNTMTTDGTDYATVTAPDGTVLFSGPGNTAEGTRLVVKHAPEESASPSAAP